MSQNNILKIVCSYDFEITCSDDFEIMCNDDFEIACATPSEQYKCRTREKHTCFGLVTPDSVKDTIHMCHVPHIRVGNF